VTVFAADLLHEVLAHVNVRTTVAADCSPVLSQAATELGLDIPSTGDDLLALCQASDSMIELDVAKFLRASLLFVRIATKWAVSVSMGNGTEAVVVRGSSYGVDDSAFDNTAWAYAAVLPGVVY
jgi:hypothetical protein